MLLIEVDYVEAILEFSQVGPATAISEMDLHQARSLRVEDPGSSMHCSHFGSLHHGRHILQLIAGELRDEDLFLYGTTSDIHFFLAGKMFVECRRVSLPNNK